MGATAAFRVVFAVVALLALTAVPAHSSDGRVITTSLAIDPQATTTVYAGTYGGGVFKSMDGGASWSPTGLTNIYVLSLAIDPQSPTTLYAGEDGGAVYKSTDGGATWNRIVLNPLSSGPCGPCGGVLALAIDPLIPTTIFGGTDVIYTQSEDGFLYTVPGAVYKTTDVGATFSIVYSGPTVSMSSLAIAPRTAAETPLTLYAGHTVSPWWVNSADVLNSGGVLKSMDGGASWDVTGLTDIDSVWALAIDPRTPTTLYAGEYGGAVFKSTDGGASWNAIGLTGVGVSALAIDPLTPTTVYAGSDGSRSGGVFKSTDGGISWNAIGLVATGRVSALAIDSSAPTTVYAATDGGVYKSTNGGASWDATGLIHWLHLSSVSLNPTRVAPGGASTGTVTLNAPAPAGGAIVTLYSDADVATLAASVTVADGATSADLVVSTSPVTSRTAVTIWAGYGGVWMSAALTLGQPIALASFSLDPPNVTGGNTSSGTVSLSAAATAGGALVTLSTSNAAIATVPASVIVVAGATTATFTVSTSSVSAPTSETISGTYGGVTRSAALTVAPPTTLSALSLSPTTMTGGSASTGTVTLDAAAPAGGAAVTLSSGNPSIATVPASVTVPAGAISATFTASTPACASGTVTISGTSGGAVRSADLVVTTAPDTIAIQAADYFATKRELAVAAKSTNSTAALRAYVTSTAEFIGQLIKAVDGTYRGRFAWPVDPKNITVRSSACGSGTKAVTSK